MPSSRPHGNFVTSFFETVKCTVKHEFIMMPVTKVVQNSASKCTKSVWRPGCARTRWGSLQHSPRPPSWVYQWGRGGSRKGKDMRGWTAEGRGSEEGGKGGWEEGWKREKGEISPTGISKSRCLCFLLYQKVCLSNLYSFWSVVDQPTLHFPADSFMFCFR